MPIDLPVVLLIAAVALVVASTVAQRAGAHADREAGRLRVAHADRRGPIGAVVDVLDKSVAAYTVRARLGLSTMTREERRAADQRAAAIAHAEDIRRVRIGAPKRLVVAGSPGDGAPVGTPARSTLSVELLAAGLGLVVVVGIVIGMWPQERGGVLSATGAPAVSTAPSPVATPSPTASPEPAAT
jgi:hypothetical protein